jgi:ATP-binding cassette subfamily F protein uup
VAARRVVKAPAPAKRERVDAPTAPAVKRKLSYKEKFALENLPRDIARLNAEIADIEARMADGDFFTRDPDGFAKASLRHAEARAALETAEDQWLELELLKGELEG